MCDLCNNEEEKKVDLTEEEIDNIIVERYNDKDEKTKVFIRKALRVHGDKFDYYNAKYTNAKTKIIITCRIHGDFEQNSSSHLCGSGCSKCAREKASENYRYKKEDFLKLAIELYGDKYNYDKVDYVDYYTPIIITCPVHGDILISPHNHISCSCGCPKCGVKTRTQCTPKTTEQFIEDARKVHSDKYDYSKVNYINSKSKVTIICPKHGVFEQSAGDHLSGKGCSLCGNTSIGEENIILFLKSSNISFEQHKHLNINDKLIIPDFVIDNKIWIEYNGRQHYEYSELFHSHSNKSRSFLDQLNRDILVRKYCKDSNIMLVEIPYTIHNYTEISDFLNKVLIQHIDPNTLVDYSKLYKLENTGLNLEDLFPT
jgi:hypothetical protein